MSDVAFDRQSALLKAERTHYADEIERQRQAMAMAQRTETALDGLEQLRCQLIPDLMMQRLRIAGGFSRR